MATRETGRGGKKRKAGRVATRRAKADRTERPKVEQGPRDLGDKAAAGGELLDMNQAIAILKTTRPTFYRWLRSGKLKGMKVGRQWRFYREDIERFLRGHGPRIDLPADIGPLLEKLREEIGRSGARPVELGGEDRAREAVTLMLQLGAVMGASDIHVAAESETVRVRMRLDGVLHPVVTYDLRLHPAVVAAWKSLASCDIHETGLPQDGRILVELPDIATPVDIRVSFLPAYGGEAVTARVLRREEVQVTIDRLGLPPEDERILLTHVESPQGLIVVTGPTGSGKTTTLYACLNHLVRPEIKLVSIEDPVELALDGVVQVAVRAHPSRTFPAVCRAALRADPDVIMVGEIRGGETANLCAQMALTGHLVLTTLHTEDAATALVRLVEVGVPAFVVGDAAKLVAAQRLVRRLCRACSKPGTPGTDELGRAEELARAGGVDWAAVEKQWRVAVGCTECRNTGYRGRAAVYELLEMTPEFGVALRRSAGAAELRTIAIGRGMRGMGARAVAMAGRGETTLAEVMRVMAVQ